MPDLPSTAGIRRPIALIPPSSVRALAEPAPGSFGLLRARQRGTRSRRSGCGGCGGCGGCRRDGRPCAPQVADPEPAFKAIRRGANAVAGPMSAWAPGETLDFVAVGEDRQT